MRYHPTKGIVEIKGSMRERKSGGEIGGGGAGERQAEAIILL